MVYHSAGAGIRGAVTHPVPLKTLVEFNRITLPASGEATLKFELDEAAFLLTNDLGNKTMYPGERTIIVSRGNGQDVEISVTL